MKTLDNKEIQKRIELIKDELTDLQGQLKEPRFEVGEWVRVKQKGHVQHDTLVMLKFGIGGCKWTGIKVDGKDGDGFEDFNLTKSTHKEVEKALIKEAKLRGFKEGVRFKSVCNKSECTMRDNKLLNWNGSTLWNNGIGRVFQNGKWATIIEQKEMTQKDIEKELGYKIKIIS